MGIAGQIILTVCVGHTQLCAHHHRCPHGHPKTSQALCECPVGGKLTIHLYVACRLHPYLGIVGSKCPWALGIHGPQTGWALTQRSHSIKSPPKDRIIEHGGAWALNYMLTHKCF